MLGGEQETIFFNGTFSKMFRILVFSEKWFVAFLLKPVTHVHRPWQPYWRKGSDLQNTESISLGKVKRVPALWVYFYSSVFFLNLSKLIADRHYVLHKQLMFDHSCISKWFILGIAWKRIITYMLLKNTRWK